MLALVVVPPISVGVRKFGRFLRELSHKTQAAAAAASSIAEVCICSCFSTQSNFQLNEGLGKRPKDQIMANLSFASI